MLGICLPEQVEIVELQKKYKAVTRKMIWVTVLVCLFIGVYVGCIIEYLPPNSPFNVQLLVALPLCIITNAAIWWLSSGGKWRV